MIKKPEIRIVKKLESLKEEHEKEKMEESNLIDIGSQKDLEDLDNKNEKNKKQSAESPLKELNSDYYKTLKIDKYSDRPFIINEKKVGKVLSYIEPFDYNDVYKINQKKKIKPKQNYGIKGGIKIGKVAPRDDSFLLNQNNFPSPNYYNPTTKAIKPNERNGNISFKYF